jgi:Cytochrome c554 and c-prime
MASYEADAELQLPGALGNDCDYYCPLRGFGIYPETRSGTIGECHYQVGRRLGTVQWNFRLASPVGNPQRRHHRGLLLAPIVILLLIARSWPDFWIDESAVMACLRCHATAATTADHLQADQMIPGVGCEGCHGPGGQHIEAMQGGNANNLHIFNPSHLPPGRITAFCGACHRTTTQEKALNLHGVENVRFQAYRLESSRCFDPEDRRISCIGCHNPHQMVERDVTSYDAKCLACHNASVPTTRHCPASKRDCVTCHMPKVLVPGAHAKFTDHRIRVARPGEPYPD